MENFDVVLVMGANDVVNSAAQDLQPKRNASDARALV